MALSKRKRQIPLSEGQLNPIGKNWITQCLNRHPVSVTKFASRINWQHASANDPWQIPGHFRRLGTLIQQKNIKPRGITNVDKKAFIMGYSKRTKAITRYNCKNPRVKQDGSQEFVTGLEDLSAYGYVFPSF